MQSREGQFDSPVTLP
nr:unnamed protein product [Callosobruchus chinensis]